MRSRPGSFEQFVDLHVEDLLRTAAVITWDDDEAEDLVQECLLQVARRWHRVRTMQAPLAYARRVLVNLAIDGRRRRARRRSELHESRGRPYSEPHAEPLDVDAAAAFDTLGDRAELLEAFGQLSPQQRTVLMLRYYHDLSEAQVAELLGCSAGTVKSSASRGLARLREILKSSHLVPEVCEQ